MTRATRFNLWIVLVVGLVLIQHAWLAGSPWLYPAHAVASVAVSLMLLGLLTLLATTPPDAIILPTWKSVILLTLLTAALYGHVWLRTSASAADGLAVVFIAAAAAAFASRAWRRGMSPWAVVVPLWNPLTTGPTALPLWPSVGVAAAWLAVFTVVTRRRD